VVEKQGELFIILDVIRIFTQSEEDKAKPRGGLEPVGDALFTPPPASAEPTAEQKAAVSDSAQGFIRDSLQALKRFTLSSVNDRWFRQRFNEWGSLRSGSELQLKNANDAEEYLSTFYSPGTGIFWNDDYAAAIRNSLPDLPSNNIQAWDLGCGKGYETFSLACILKSRYPMGHIKIWANDNDIMAISNAPNMVFDLEDVPEFARSYMIKGKNGYSFNQDIKDTILFEYHDVLNGNVIPEVDIILVRDLLSFVSAQEQERLMADFAEKLKPRGIIILGRNEELPEVDWQPVAKDPVSAYMRA
jgi:purine-binding chemotaxis protein CheW